MTLSSRAFLHKDEEEQPRQLGRADRGGEQHGHRHAAARPERAHRRRRGHGLGQGQGDAVRGGVGACRDGVGQQAVSRSYPFLRRMLTSPIQFSKFTMSLESSSGAGTGSLAASAESWPPSHREHFVIPASTAS